MNTTQRASGEGTSSDTTGRRNKRFLSVPSSRTETSSVLGSSVGFLGSMASRKSRRVPSSFQKPCGWKLRQLEGETAVT